MFSVRCYEEIRQLKLMAARLIFRALCDYVHNKKWANGHRPKNKRDRTNKASFEAARDWLFDSSTEDLELVCLEKIEDGFLSVDEAAEFLSSMEEELMSFEAACDILKWSPDWVRRRIPRLKAADLRRVGKKNGFL
jgi:hypothetical protein